MKRHFKGLIAALSCVLSVCLILQSPILAIETANENNSSSDVTVTEANLAEILEKNSTNESVENISNASDGSVEDTDPLDKANDNTDKADTSATMDNDNSIETSASDSGFQYDEDGYICLHYTDTNGNSVAAKNMLVYSISTVPVYKLNGSIEYLSADTHYFDSNGHRVTDGIRSKVAKVVVITRNYMENTYDERDGKVYLVSISNNIPELKNYTGLYENMYYLNGSLGTGVHNSVYYVNGIAFTGTYSDGKYYVNGSPANGIYGDIYYADGVYGTGEYNGVYYQNGVVYTAPSNQNTSSTSTSSNTPTIPTNGYDSSGKYYQNGSLYTGTVAVSGSAADFFIDGVKITSYRDQWVTFSINGSSVAVSSRNSDDTYYFNSNGQCVIGWNTLKRNGSTYKYYFYSDGKLCKNLYKVSTSWKKKATKFVANRTMENGTLYAKNGKTYNIPTKSFVFSSSKTNSNFRNGTYHFSQRKRWFTSKKIKWYYQWATYISGSGTWVHSEQYVTKNINSFNAASYNKLGTKQSLNCLRMQVVNAKLIYDMKPYIKQIVLTRSNNAGPFGKMTLYDNVDRCGKIPNDMKYDPTDPSIG